MRMSGVKNSVSNAGALLRGLPFNQVKSPKANGVNLSTGGDIAGDGAGNTAGDTAAVLSSRGTAAARGAS